MYQSVDLMTFAAGGANLTMGVLGIGGNRFGIRVLIHLVLATICFYAPFI